MLEVVGLRVSYGDRVVLADMNATVERGEVVGLLGPTGCGKTTLLRAISGVTPWLAGEVRVAGEPTAKLGRRSRSQRIAVVPQNPALPVGFTALEVVLMGRTPHLRFFEQEGPADYRRACQALETVGAADLAGRRVEELSGGERQKVALARGLAQDAPISLLDEPTAHLDIAHQITIAQLLRELARGSGLAVLAAIHDLTLAALYCDRVILMRPGSVIAEGSPDKVLTAENIGRAYGADVAVLRQPGFPGPIIAPYSLS